MTVAELFSKIRRRKVQAQADAWQPYRELLLEVCRGDEVDPDEAEIVLTSLGKSQADFENDVATMQRRLSAQTAMQAGQQAKSKAAAAWEQHRKLCGEYQAMHDRLQPQINQAYQAAMELESVVANADTAANSLRRSCMDPGIVDRESQLVAKRKDLLERRQTIVNHAGTNESNLRRNRESIPAMQKTLTETKPEYREQVQKQIAATNENIRQFQGRLEKANADRADIDAELASIEKQLEAISAEKLTP